MYQIVNYLYLEIKTMHTRRILLVKATDSDEARSLAEEFLNDNGSNGEVWDWYEVGGRWTGYLTGYDPKENENNYEPCTICNGTGMRNDEAGKKARKEDPTYTCNGCGGTGKRLKWNLEPYDGDALPLSECIEKVKKAHKEMYEIDKYEQGVYNTAKDLFKDGVNFKAKGISTFLFWASRRQKMMDDYFDDLSMVFDTEEFTHDLPKDTEEYYAVVVDTHN